MSSPGDDAFSPRDFGGFDDAFSPEAQDERARGVSSEQSAPAQVPEPEERRRDPVPPLAAAERARLRRRMATLAATTAAFVTVVQVAVFSTTGSSVALAGAAQSAAAFLGSIVAGIAIRGEDRLAGPEKQAGWIEGVVVLGAAACVAIASLARFGHVPAHALPAAAVVAACAVLSWLAAGRLRLGAAEIGSDGVGEDAALASSNGNRTILIALALGLVALTGFGPLDGIAALLAVAGVIGSGIELVRSSHPGQEGISAAEHETISQVLSGGPAEVVGYRETSARTAAGMRRIDVVVTVRSDTPESRLREIWAATEPLLTRRLPRERVVVHVERPAVPPSSDADAGTRLRRP